MQILLKGIKIVMTKVNANNFGGISTNSYGICLFAGITMSFCQSVTILLDGTLLEIFSNLSVFFPVLLSK